MDEIEAAVVEIEAEDARGARAALDRIAGVQSVAQLGTRLHALLDRELAEPVAAVEHALAEAGVEGNVRRVGASLEDVFVAVTRARGEEAPR
jgi:ABC-2 type transport system ATP-binding protein